MTIIFNSVGTVPEPDEFTIEVIGGQIDAN